ncbi:unnamed protein product [Closterium sp. NIES-53]
MALRPSFVPLRVPLPSPHASSLAGGADPESDLVRAASPTVRRLLATVVTDPSFESIAASALEDFEHLAAAVPHLVAVLLAPEGDLDAPDIPTPRSYAEAITVPPHGANIVDGMWIFRVKQPPGSSPAFKACYVARGFSQRHGVDFFQTFSPTSKMTTLWVLLHVTAQRDYELHSLDFSTAFLQGSLHKEIWLRRPPGFTGTTLAALGFAPSTSDPSLFLRTDNLLPPFYILVYVDDLVFATADTEAPALVKSELQKRHTCTDLGPSALRLPVKLIYSLHYAPGPSAPAAATATTTAAAAATAAATAALACCATMASLRVLAFDHKGRPVQFDTWLDNLQLYLLSDSKDSVLLFDLASGAAPAPPATADSATRAQWLTRDAAARLAICNHLPLAECAYFGQHRTAQALYDAVVTPYSSLATAALGRLLLPYLFPELSAFAMVEDLVSHLRTSDARYRATVPAKFLDKNQPPMFITLYFIVTRLPDSLRSVRDHFLSLDLTSLTIDLLEQHLLAAKTSAVAVGAARGTPRPPFFEGCSPSPLAPSYASAAAADVPGAEDVGPDSASAERCSGKGKGSRGGGGGSWSGGGGSSGDGGGSGGVGSGGSGGGSGGVGGGGGGSGGSGDSGGGGTGGGRTGAPCSGAGGTGAGGARVDGTGVGGASTGGAGAGGAGAVDPGGAVRPRPYFVPLLQQVLGVPSSTGLTPPLLCPPPDQLQLPLQPASPLTAPSLYTEQFGGLIEHREPASHPVSPVPNSLRVPRSRPPPVPGTHAMDLRPSSVPLRVPLPPPPESSLPVVPDPESDRARAASPTVSRLLATAVTDPSFESAVASALIDELLDFAAACRLDYATALVAESEFASPPSVGGECALGTDVLEERQKDLECLPAAVPCFASMLLALEGDPDAPDIPTPRSYAEAITGPFCSQWQAAMDAEMASWKSAGTCIDEVPPPRANIVDGMWIFRVNRPPDSPLAFKARYVARGFSQ